MILGLIKSLTKKVVWKVIGGDMIEKVIELLKPVSQKFSTKFLLAGGSVYALYHLAGQGKLDPLSGAAIVVINIAYYFSRHRQEVREQEKIKVKE